MNASAAAITLPAILDIQAAEVLRTELLAVRGQALTLDGSSVERLGGLCLQVLLSARRTWAEDGQPFVLEPLSDDFTDQWAALGAPGDLLGAFS